MYKKRKTVNLKQYKFLKAYIKMEIINVKKINFSKHT